MVKWRVGNRRAAIFSTERQTRRLESRRRCNHTRALDYCNEGAPMTLLPDRAWRSIQMRGWLAGIERKSGPRPQEERTLVMGNGESIIIHGRDLSYSDIVFMNVMNYRLTSQSIEWTTPQERSDHPPLYAIKPNRYAT